MSVIGEYLDNIEFGKVQEFDKMAVLPLINPDEGGAVYLTLKEALDMDLLTITEVSDSGSVPELKAINKSELPVLILDGEELVGAKQNRVLNATILLKGDSETILPVSCTEEGRWSYKSPRFRDSGSVLSHSFRSSKRGSVSNSLRFADSYTSDQRSIWNGIRETLDSESCESPTRAHEDIYKSRYDDIDKYLGTFDILEGQIGILVFINGEIFGIDTVSSHISYRALHEKLMKSYAMEAVLNRIKSNNTKLNREKKAKSFIEEIKDSGESKYKSIGHGWDHRFESKTISGSALVCQGEVIHGSFFRNNFLKDENMRDLSDLVLVD